jgi:hypothetical protein
MNTRRTDITRHESILQARLAVALGRLILSGRLTRTRLVGLRWDAWLTRRLWGREQVKLA